MRQEESQMTIIQKTKEFLSKPFFKDYRTLFGLWLLLPIVAALTKISKHNNYDIFRYVFWHTWEQSSLYAKSAAYWDVNHYGPFFSIIIAPFALCPLWIGLLLERFLIFTSLFYDKEVAFYR